MNIPIDPAIFPPEVVAWRQQKLNTKKYYNQRAKWRQFMRDGLEGTASAYAKKHGLDAAQMKAEMILQAQPLESLPPAPVPGASTLTPGPEPARASGPQVAGMVNGWPEETKATIWAACRNRRLVLIHLPDGREAVMWTTGRRWRIGGRLTVKLDSDQAKGDPRYLPVAGSME